MWDCFIIKRKLYDYFDKSLSEEDMLKVESHLKRCAACSKRLAEIRTLIDIAAQKQTPEPSEEFWHQFQVDLDAQLNRRLVKPLHLGAGLGVRFKPVLVPLSGVLVVVLSLYLYFYKMPLASRLDAALIEEAAMLEEVSPGINILNGEESFLEDIDLS